MTASLPVEVQQVFDRFRTAALATIDGRGQPICRPVTPHYAPGDPCIDITTPRGDRGRAAEARANPKVALLFSDPAGCGMENAPQVLVQGMAEVDRIARRLFLAPLRVRVRPERIFAWPNGDATREPRLFDAHLEEVRSGHDEEPPAPHAGAEGGGPVWDERIEKLGVRHPSAIVSLAAPDGFPFSIRVRIEVDGETRRIRLGRGAVGVPVQPGLACVTAPDLQVRGDLVEEDGDWVVIPHRLVAKKSETRT